MGKTRKRSKFFKLFSCLNGKTGSVDENMRELDEKSSPLSSPFNDIDSSSPGKPTWPPSHVVHQGATGKRHHGDGNEDGCQATPGSPSGSKERVRHEYSSTGSLIVTWPSYMTSRSPLRTSQYDMTSREHRPLQSRCRVNVCLQKLHCLLFSCPYPIIRQCCYAVLLRWMNGKNASDGQGALSTRVDGATCCSDCLCLCANQLSWLFLSNLPNLNFRTVYRTPPPTHTQMHVCLHIQNHYVTLISLVPTKQESE